MATPDAFRQELVPSPRIIPGADIAPALLPSLPGQEQEHNTYFIFHGRGDRGRHLLGALVELLACAIATLDLDKPVPGGDVLHVGRRRRAALAVAAKEVCGAGCTGGRGCSAARRGGESLGGRLTHVLGRGVVQAAHGAQLAQGRAGSAVGVLEVAFFLGAVGAEQVTGVVAQAAMRKAGRRVVVKVEVRRLVGAGRAAGTVAFLSVVGPRRLRGTLGLAIAQAEVLIQPFGHRLSRPRPVSTARCPRRPARQPSSPPPPAWRSGAAGRARRPPLRAHAALPLPTTGRAQRRPPTSRRDGTVPGPARARRSSPASSGALASADPAAPRLQRSPP